MSVQAMAWVFEHSEATRLERQILQSHANHAGGAEPPWLSYTGVETVAHESRATRKGVQLATRRLVELERLIDTGERRPDGRVVYRIALDSPADAVDRAKRLKREETERTRNRRGSKRGANRVRPGNQLHEGEPGTPPEDELGTPPGAERNAAGAEQDAASADLSTPEPSYRQEPSAANAAAAGEPAVTDRSSSEVQESRREDPGLRWWDVAVQLLTAGDMGFSELEVEAQRPQILAELRKHAGKLADWPWKRVTEQVIAGRADGTIVANSPIGVLAFAVRQSIPAGAPPSAAAKASGIGHVSDRRPLPETSPEAAAAWAQLLEAFEQLENWDEVQTKIGTLLGFVHPLTLADGVLRLSSSSPVAAPEIRDRVVAFAAQFLRDRRASGRVAFVPRDEAVIA